MLACDKAPREGSQRGTTCWSRCFRENVWVLVVSSCDFCHAWWWFLFAPALSWVLSWMNQCAWVCCGSVLSCGITCSQRQGCTKSFERQNVETGMHLACGAEHVQLVHFGACTNTCPSPQERMCRKPRKGFFWFNDQWADQFTPGLEPVVKKRKEATRWLVAS